RDDRRLLAGHDRRQQPGLAQQDEPLSVAHVEALQLVAVLGVVQAAVGEDAVHIRDQRADGCPAWTPPATHRASTGPPWRASAKGKAMTASATSRTSVSPKLYSKRPATRKVTTAARAPSTSARSPSAALGSRRSRAAPRTRKATKIHSHAARPSRPRSTVICRGVLCRWLVECRRASAGATLGYRYWSWPGPTPTNGCWTARRRPASIIASRSRVVSSVALPIVCSRALTPGRPTSNAPTSSASAPARAIPRRPSPVTATSAP